jgi:hypothetical protein
MDIIIKLLVTDRYGDPKNPVDRADLMRKATDAAVEIGQEIRRGKFGGLHFTLLGVGADEDNNAR